MSRTDDLRALGGRREPRTAASRQHRGARTVPLSALVVAAILCGLVAAVAVFGLDRGRDDSIVLSSVEPRSAESAAPTAAPAAATAESAAASAAPAPGPAPAATDPPPAAATGVPSAPPVQVHVAGAVGDPGVVALPEGARVVDALAAAGGERADADLARLNLAAPVADGSRIYVPAAGEEVPAALGDPAPPAAGVSPDGDAPPGTADGAGPVNLNTATSEELQTLPGVGPKTAAAILDHRDENGPFSRAEDLLEISGIGPKTLADLTDEVTV